MAADRIWSGAVPQRMRVPAFIHMELTTACGMGCPQCYVASCASPVHMDYELCRRVIAEAAEAGIAWILLTGGEPLLYPNLVDCVQEMTAKGICASLSTSGMGLKRGLVADLRCAGLAEACVSLNGSSQEVHGLSRTGFDEAVQAVCLFVSGGVRTCVNWVARSDNLHDFPGFVSLCGSLGVRRIDVLACKRHGGMLESALSDAETDRLADMMAKYDSRLVGIELCYERLRKRVKGAPRTPFSGKCGGGRVFFDVLAGGEKTICRHIATGRQDTMDWTLTQYWRSLGNQLENAPYPCQMGD